MIRKLDRKPAVIGHSFGGLLTQILAGRGVSAVSVAIDPAPFRGVLPLPVSALRSGSPVLRNPANRHRAVPLTYEQFRYAFANTLSDDEAKSLYEGFAVPGSGEPSSRQPPRTSTRGQRPRSTPRTPTGAHYWSSPANSTTLCPGRSRRVLQAAKAQPRRDRNRRDQRPGPLPDHRQRLARGGRYRPSVRAAIRLARRYPRGTTHGRETPLPGEKAEGAGESGDGLVGSGGDGSEDQVVEVGGRL